jgi:dienelactone hydrolase
MPTAACAASKFRIALLCGAALICTLSPEMAAAQDNNKAAVRQDASAPAVVTADKRTGPLKNLDGYFPFEPYNSRAAWDQRAEQLRRQLLVATGLWPLPERTPPRAVVHGKVDRDEYTVEKVILESWPGHYVTGNLYRPKGKQGKLPAVLCPHGHWADGRFYDAGEAGVRRQIEQGAEKFDPSGRYPLQARCVQLARMGCIVFHYDMLGYADSIQIPQAVAHGFRERRPAMEGHKEWGFFSPQAELHLQSILGLQTYNSVRALDWLSELPDVDAHRIGVTGASGGGTQTFVLCAIDPRPAVAFPAVMVSTAMQGGCTCENCSYLRIGTGNIEIAALIAPRPLGMTAANDWTKEMPAKGYPQLKEHYKLLGVPDKVTLTALVQFEHNYNYPSRAAMYEWMNRHLALERPTPVVETDFKPLSREEMSVWNDDHPAPTGDAVGESYERTLVRQMTDEARRRFEALRPQANRPETVKEFERVIGGAWDTLIGRTLPERGEVEFKAQRRDEKEDYTTVHGLVVFAKADEQLPAVVLLPSQRNGGTVIWLDERGKQALFTDNGQPTAAVKKLLEAGSAVVGVDLLYQGDFLRAGGAEGRLAIKHPRNFAGFTYGYNYPLFVERVHDVLSTIAAARDRGRGDGKIHMVGFGPAAGWAAAAAAQAGEAVASLTVDSGFRFADIKDLTSQHLVPGAVKYGDVDALLALAKPKSITIYGRAEAPLAQVACSLRGDRTKLVFVDDQKQDAKAEDAARRLADR